MKARRAIVALDRKVAVSSLPFGMESSFQPLPGHSPIRGPIWFGEVERPNGTLYAGGVPRMLCDTFERADEAGGGGGCAPLGHAREYGLLSIESCGKGTPTRFRVTGLIPDGVTALEVIRAGGSIALTVPVLDNTVAFTLGHETVAIRGVGEDPPAGLDQELPLGTVGHVAGTHGCTTYGFPQTPATEF